MNSIDLRLKSIVTFIYFLGIVSLSVVFFSCSKFPLNMPDATENQMLKEEVSIGVVVAMTGRHAEAYGFAMQRGFELAREEINSRGEVKIKFITVDDQSTPEGAREAVQYLVDQEVSAIVGLAISTHLKAVAPIAQEHGVIAFSSVSSAAGLSGIGDFIFRTSLATNISIPSGLMVTQKRLGYRKVATIYDEIDVYARNSNEVLRQALETNGVEVLTMETFQTGDIDFSQQLNNIIALRPDALFISALSQEIAQIIKQTSVIGVPDNISIIAPDLTMNEVQKAGDAAEGVIGFIGWSNLSDAPGNRSFVRNYRTKYGIQPEPWAAQSYTTLYVLTNAIKIAQSTDATLIRNALAETTDYPTILGMLGKFSFNPDGDALYDQIIMIVKDGKLQPFE